MQFTEHQPEEDRAYWSRSLTNNGDEASDCVAGIGVSDPESCSASGDLLMRNAGESGGKGFRLTGEVALLGFRLRASREEKEARLEGTGGRAVSAVRGGDGRDDCRGGKRPVSSEPMTADVALAYSMALVEHCLGVLPKLILGAQTRVSHKGAVPRNAPMVLYILLKTVIKGSDRKGSHSPWLA